MWVPYEELPEDVKQADREWACKTIDLLMKDHMTVLCEIIKRGM